MIRKATLRFDGMTYRAVNDERMHLVGPADCDSQRP